MVACLSVKAQGPLVNGYSHLGYIGSVSNIDAWTFSANAGDAIIVRAGEIYQDGYFDPRLQVFGPGVGLVASNYGSDAVEVAFTATTSGTFTVYVDDFSSNATNYYRINLVKTGSPLFVSLGDEGGPMTSGLTHYGTITIGDLDAWTVSATAGETIIVRMGETNDFGGFYPRVRIYSPNGILLSPYFGSWGNYAGEISVTASNTGDFIVVAGDNNATQSLSGTGNYRIKLAKIGAPFSVSPNDEGGPMISGLTNFGTIPTGDMDLWTFNALAGNRLILQLTKLSGGTSFNPEMRLYGPNGVLLNTVWQNTTVQIDRIIPTSGNYTLLVGETLQDLTGTTPGAGTYQLTGVGISSALTLNKPIINGTNIVISAVGGMAGSNCVLLSSTDLTLPLNNWTPIRTNQFSTFGEFSVTNVHNVGVTQQYYRVRTP